MESGQNIVLVSEENWFALGGYDFRNPIPMYSHAITDYDKVYIIHLGRIFSILYAL